MIRYFTLLLILFFGTPILPGQNLIEQNIYFGSDQYSLNDSSLKQLNTLVDKLKGLTIREIKLSGHTDSDGNNAYNEQLSRSRVSVVADYLVSKGIEKNLIQVDYKGEANPATTNNDEGSKQKNRRVELSLSYVPPVPVIQKPTLDTTKAIPESKLSQTFTVSPAKDIVIKGKKGTVIKIFKNSLVDKKGNVIRGNVTIELKEIYSKSDMILNGIQTMSDGKLLETDGMIFLKVSFNNKEVFMKSKPYTYSYYVEMPTALRKTNMSVFYGDSIHGTDNWHKADNIRAAIGDGPVQTDSMSNYIFPASKFGWINCDKFTNVKNKTDLAITLKDTNKVSVCLVFKDINSVMNVNGNEKKGLFFPNVPVGQVATLVAYAKRSNDVLFYSKEVNIEKNLKETISLEIIDTKTFEEKIKQFD